MALGAGKIIEWPFYEKRSSVFRLFASPFFVVFIAAAAFGIRPILYTYDETTNRLISFKDDSPELLLSSVPLAIPAGSLIHQLDFRPATGELYGLRLSNINANGADLLFVKINWHTGAVTDVGTPFSIPNSGTVFGFNFDPVEDRIRLVTGADHNVEIDPDTGAIAETNTPLSYASGDRHFGQNPNISYIAYSNRLDGATTAYGLDLDLSALVTIGSPNGSPFSPRTGKLFTIQDVLATPTSAGGFDIQTGTNASRYIFRSFSGTSTDFGGLFLDSGSGFFTGNVGTGSDVLHGAAILPFSPNPGDDFDGDTKSDISVFRPSNGTWYLQQSTSGFAARSFGIATDKIVPADFDGDGITDVAVYRPSSGTWYWKNSSNGAFRATHFGSSEDLPTPADYDGDGKADISVFRPSNGVWYRLNSSNGSFYAAQFGVSEDKPTVGDFDGDGKADIAVWRPSNGAWYRLNSSNGQFVAVGFGLSDDLITPADFDGDSKTDIAVYRPSTGIWYWLNSTNGTFNAAQFGVSEDIPSAADFDGDGKADIAVFRPSNGNWYRLNSSNGAFIATNFGLTGDRPTPAAFRY